MSRRWLILLLNLVLPGIGHVFVGLGDRGLLLFLAILLSANGLLLATLGVVDSLHHPGWQIFFGLLLTGFWGYTLWDTWRFTRALSGKVKAYVEERLKRVVLAYLENDYPRMRRHLRKVLKRDPYNSDAYFYLAVLAKRQGREKEAQRFFRRCVLFDRENKWAETICLLYEMDELVSLGDSSCRASLEGERHCEFPSSSVNQK